MGGIAHGRGATRREQHARGVARTHWRAGQYLDLFGRGGGGFGFLSVLWWLPQLQLGIAVLTNSDDHDLQVALALGILRDLVTDPDSRYHDRTLSLPIQSDVIDSDGDFMAPPDLADRIAAVACRPRASSPRGGPDTPSGTGPDTRAPWTQRSRRRGSIEFGVPYFDAVP